MHNSLVPPKTLALFLAAMFIGSSLSGLALLLWENKPLTKWQRIGGVLLSGFAGCIVALLLYEKMHDSPAVLAGISLLAGIGGASTIEFLMALAKKKLTNNEK